MLLLVGVKGKFKLSNWGHCNENRLVGIIGGTGIEAMNEWQLYGGRNCTDGLTRKLTVASVGRVPIADGRESQEQSFASMMQGGRTAFQMTPMLNVSVMRSAFIPTNSRQVASA